MMHSTAGGGIPSRDLPLVSGKKKNACKPAATLNVPNIRKVFHARFWKEGGVKYEIANPSIQFAEVATETTLPRSRIGYISGG